MSKSYTNSELCLVWLDSFLGLEYKHKKELYKLINGKDGIKEVLESGKEYLIANLGENKYASLLSSANASYLNFIIKGLSDREIKAVTLVSEEYPKTLAETPFAPLVLYAKGNIELLNTNCFAVVGSRKSLPVAINTAKDISKSLCASGLTLVTGIAQGVDQAVLESALENGGKAISVLGGGFDNIYPATNAELVERLTESNLVISEYPPEITALPHHFPIRNRIIAGLSKGALIVSGATKSGTQYTANYAVEYGRDLFAVPYNVGVPSGAGCNELIKRGAMLCDCAEDILDFYGLEKSQKQSPKLSELELEIVNALKDGESHIQSLSQKLGKQVFEITPIISILEIKGIVNKNGINVYGLTANAMEE